MRTFWMTLVLLLSASLGMAQTPVVVTPNSQLIWDMAAPDQATAARFIYRVYVDTGTPAQLPNPACIGSTSPFRCAVPVPAMQPGGHVITMDAGDGTTTSPKSTALSVVVMFTIGPPMNLRLGPSSDLTAATDTSKVLIDKDLGTWRLLPPPSGSTFFGISLNGNAIPDTFGRSLVICNGGKLYLVGDDLPAGFWYLWQGTAFAYQGTTNPCA